MLKICKDLNPILRKKCMQVDKITDEHIEFSDKMLQTMYEHKGVGLAAPQIGVLEQMIVIDVGTGPLKLINPQILKKDSRQCISKEGCLSLTNISVDVKRSNQITVEAVNLRNEKIKIEAVDLLARILQHEIDHLHGKLIIDYLPWYKRLVFYFKFLMS